VPGGVLTPLEVLTSQAAGPGVAQRLAKVPGIAAALLPAGPSGSRAAMSDVIAIPRAETVNNLTLGPVRAVQAAVDPLPGVVGVTGEGPAQQDYSHAVFGHFPLT
jgi:RND superfamily putative drug exporter